MLKQSEIKRDQLPPEPEEGTPETSTIVLRLPTGERVTRRFNKNEQVQLLYDFIDANLQKIEFESADYKYSIIQTMPRKEFKDKNKTLVQEGLFPRAMLQIKEEDE